MELLRSVKIVEKKKKEQQDPANEEQTPVREPETEAPSEPAPPSELELARAEAEDMKRKWYLVTAEYENYRKRTARESAQRYAEGRADVVKGLFPIADNLERALESCAEEGTRKGIEMVMESFRSLLREEKIEEINPVGQPFDAETDEAIMAVDPAEGETGGTVKQVYRKGYRQNGKVLRYAQVVVIK